MRFKQCTLHRKGDGVTMVTTTWLPEKYAKKGRFIRLKDRDTGQWHDHWEVRQVGSVFREGEEVVERSQDHKKTRAASDI